MVMKDKMDPEAREKRDKWKKEMFEKGYVGSTFYTEKSEFKIVDKSKDIDDYNYLINSFSWSSSQRVKKFHELVKVISNLICPQNQFVRLVTDDEIMVSTKEQLEDWTKLESIKTQRRYQICFAIEGIKKSAGFTLQMILHHLLIRMQMRICKRVTKFDGKVYEWCYEELVNRLGLGKYVIYENLDDYLKKESSKVKKEIKEEYSTDDNKTGKTEECTKRDPDDYNNSISDSESDDSSDDSDESDNDSNEENLADIKDGIKKDSGQEDSDYGNDKIDQEFPRLEKRRILPRKVKIEIKEEINTISDDEEDHKDKDFDNSSNESNSSNNSNLKISDDKIIDKKKVYIEVKQEKVSEDPKSAKENQHNEDINQRITKKPVRS